MVRAGQRMFSLDDRSDAANADKAASQVVKDQALLDAKPFDFRSVWLPALAS
jgi:multidrug efflux pump subunit AcrA (membrane-fusion protein)